MSGLILWSCGSDKGKCALVTETDLVADEAVVNLHEIIQYRFKTHVFKIKNTGRKILTVTDIEKSCGCTSVELAKDTLLPGEETTMAAVLSTQDRVGNFTSLVTLKWRPKGGKEQHQLVLTLQGKAVRLTVSEPPGIDFGDIDADKFRKATVTRQLLIRRGDAAVAWDGIEVLAESGQPVQLKALDKDTFQIQYSLSPSKHPVGVFKDDLTIRLKDNGVLLSDEIRISVIAHIKSPLTVKPTSVYLGSIAKGTVKQGVIKINHSAGQPIKILSNTSSARIRCKVQNDGMNPAIISYKYETGIQEGNISEKLIVTVTCEDRQYELAIPFIGLVQ
jgi:hypothetical protein